MTRRCICQDAAVSPRPRGWPLLLRALLAVSACATLLQYAHAQGGECKPAGTRYNEVWQISSHNSYDIDVLKPSIQEQARLGVRSFELDIHARHVPFGGSYAPGEWGVFHSTDIRSGGDHCQTLTECLKQVRAWHDENPAHEPITLWLQVVNNWSPGHDPTDLDANLSSTLGGSLFRPAEFFAACPAATTLQAAARTCGWPTLSALAGRFLVVLHGNDRASAEYAGRTRRDPSTVAFVAPDMPSPSTPEDPRWVNAIFYNIHNLDGQRLPTGIFALGLVSRVWRIDNQVEWTEARAGRAHHLATDHVRGEFEPRAVDRCGRSFGLFSP